MNEITEVWKDYQKGRQYLESVNLFSRVETCHNFVNGDQWKGLKYGKERPPQLNILLPVMKQSTALVGQNIMNIQYTSMNYGSNRKILLAVCRHLNSYAEKMWERLKLDKLCWDILQDAFIGGDSFLYFYDDAKSENGRIMCETIDTTNIMLGDEQQPDIQQQPYILIIQRKNIEDVKSMARANKVSEDEINNIVPDNEVSLQINGSIEVKNSQKVTVVAKLWKKEGCVHVMRTVRTVVVQPETAVPGLTRYPVAKYTWKQKKGSARGEGDIWDKIPNQISINKSLFRLEQAIKSSAYPVKVYRQGALLPGQMKKLEQPGRSIALGGSGDMPIDNIIRYLNPASVSPYAVSYWQELINQTRSLAGAGDNLENVDPEQASGVAIQAALEAKSLNVNMQVAAYRQFVEDIAWIWYDMIIAYNPEGLVFEDENEKSGEFCTTVVPAEILKGLDVDIKVNAVHSGNTWAAIRDSQLKSLFDSGHISFEEYVDALGTDSTMPREILKKIVETRKQKEKQKTASSLYSILEGGDMNEMQNLRM